MSSLFSSLPLLAASPATFLGFDNLSFSSLFPSSLPSYVNVRSTNPLDTDISTADTIALMNQHAIVDSHHPIIKSAAQDILDNVASPEDEFELIQATFEYVKEHVTFVEDEDLLRSLFGIDKGIELLITPARLLSMNRPMGDCDDFSSLVKALLLNFGIDNDYVTVAADQDNPRKWSHVYNMATLSNGEHKFIDTSHGKYLGWEAPNAERKVVWKLQSKGQRVNRNDNNMFVDKYNALGSLGDYYDSEGTYISSSLTYDPSLSTSSLPPANVIPFGSNVPGQMTQITPATPGGATTGFNLASLLAPFTNAASKIAVAQFGQPQLAPGTFIQTTPGGGSIITNQPIGGGISPLSNFGGISSSTLLMIALVGGGLLLLGGKH